MTRKSKLHRTDSDGFDRIEWLDARGAPRAIRVLDPDRGREVQPGERVRYPSKYVGQRSYQGHYWCAGTRSMVFHESMLEYGAIMLLDHLHELTAVYAQPMVLSFGTGEVHYPDYLLGTADGGRLLVDVHLSSLTTEQDERKFELTRDTCRRLGWRYEVLNEMTDTTFWNLEMLARYRHHRYEPTALNRVRILELAGGGMPFRDIRARLRTSRPGEHMPALFHMLWQSEPTFELTAPFTEETRLVCA